jgi:PleD family two-component response regulator
VHHRDALPVLAERVLAAVAEPIDAGRAVVVTAASVGVAWCVPGEAGIERLLQTSDDAMYAAKQGGRGRFRVLGPSLSDAA